LRGAHLYIFPSVHLGNANLLRVNAFRGALGKAAPAPKFRSLLLFPPYGWSVSVVKLLIYSQFCQMSSKSPEGSDKACIRCHCMIGSPTFRCPGPPLFTWGSVGVSTHFGPKGTKRPEAPAPKLPRSGVRPAICHSGTAHKTTSTVDPNCGTYFSSFCPSLIGSTHGEEQEET
jgi:hypothetical protein